jgi:hypothetical protein
VAIQRIETLKAGSDFLEFRHEYGLWYWLALTHDGSERFLGGEGILGIINRLLDFFLITPGDPPSKHPDGLLWQWILNTGMPYHSLYGRKEGDAVVLKFWDTVAGKEITQVKLTPAEVQNWVERLSDWRREVELQGDNSFI